MVHQAIAYLQSVPESTWQHWAAVLATFAVGGLGISSLTQIIKKVKSWESDKGILGFAAVLSYITAASNYIIAHAATSPFPTILGNGSKLLALAVLIHRYVVSGASTKVEAFISSKITPLFQAASVLKASKTPQNTTVNEPTSPPPELV